MTVNETANTFEPNSPAERVVALDPVASARAAGLKYVTDDIEGIRRERVGEEFQYADPKGGPIADTTVLGRIRSLGIPPAWTDVWICPTPHGHLQATGRDAKGRKQYRYHPRWREVRDQTKYDRMIAFGEALPRIRERVEHDLALPGLPREKVLAAVIRLLETTMIRVGNEEYVRQNHSFGLTTMRNRHVDVSGATLRFHFHGKSGKKHVVELHDRRLARIVRRCREIPGHHLFECQDENGQSHAIGSGEVNDYLHQIAGQEFTAKDFRTWAGTLLAIHSLRELGRCESASQGKKNVLHAIDAVKERLGNTRAVCRKYYVHPLVLEAYLDGTLLEQCRVLESAEPSRGLSAEEMAVLAFLDQRIAHETNGSLFIEADPPPAPRQSVVLRSKDKSASPTAARGRTGGSGWRDSSRNADRGGSSVPER
jgi:DNA topoisomerase-1